MLPICFARTCYSEDDTSVERSRKDVLIPAYTVLGVPLFVLWLLYLPSGYTEFTKEGRSTRMQAYDALTRLGVGAGAITAVSVVVHCRATKRLGLWTCEASGVLLVFAVLCADAAFALRGWFPVLHVTVLILDFLLLLGARPMVGNVVVWTTTVWCLVRAVIMFESAPQGCLDEGIERFGTLYLTYIFSSFFANAVVLVIDYSCTRTFAISMREQKALVDASIHLCEEAAVCLSRYEIESTQSILAAEGDKLPEHLRSAFEQMVMNLAMYKPYLPQSCFPGEDEAGCEESETPPSSRLETRTSERLVRLDSEAESTGQASSRADEDSTARMRKAVALEHKRKRTTMIAANVVGMHQFMHSCNIGSFVTDLVERYSRLTTAERGVVDVVCGDHLFATFNAVRLCTSHKLAATRTLWSATRELSAEPSLRMTGCACTSVCLSGDFGTADIRRFMVIGPLHSLVLALERVAARAEFPVAEDAVKMDADVDASFSMRLLEQVTFTKTGPQPFKLWEVTESREQQESPEEWMYELARQRPNPHDGYNRVLLLWMSGRGEEALAHLAGLESPDVALQARLSAKRQDMVLQDPMIVAATDQK